MLTPNLTKQIHFASVAKCFSDPKGAIQIVFGTSCLTIPANRRVAILGHRGSGKSTLLQLISGKILPDDGEVISTVSFSPVINASTYFHPQLTVIDNIKFIARLFCIEADYLLVLAANSLEDIKFIEHPFRTLTSPQRRNLETDIAFALPFDCYLIDDLAHLPEEALARSFSVAAERQAGVIFATSQPRLVRQYADFVVVISDTALRIFPHAKEAIQYFDQSTRKP